MNRSAYGKLVLLLSLLADQTAFAACAIGVPPPAFYVGSDNQCAYSKIQDAITAVSTTSTCAPTIYVTSEHRPWNEVLTITNRTFTLAGTTASCSTSGTHRPAELAAVTSPQATISGAGLNAPVITINGTSNVTLQGLEITGANLGADSEGGGILFTGAGSLSLNATTVDNNYADYGGGIDMSPSGNATLRLLDDALVISNVAGHSGGGIRIEGNTRLYMLGAGSTVSFNQAQFDYGGGIEIIGPARADIGSPGAVIAGAVSENSAPYGGGVAILGGPGGDATARLFATSATQPVTVSENSASAQGGAFYLKPDAQNNANTGALLCAHDFRIEDNTAPDGAAIYAEDDVGNIDLYGSTVLLNTNDECGPELASSIGAVACAAGIPCNEISANSAIEGSDPSGAVISLNYYGGFGVDRLRMRQNVGIDLVNAHNAYSDTLNYLHGCLITDNHTQHELIHSEIGYFGSGFQMKDCTVANNTIDSGYVLYSEGDFDLERSIIAEAGHSTMDHVEGGCGDAPCPFTAAYVLSNDRTTFPDTSTISQGDPLFVDANDTTIGNRDYHLLAFTKAGVLTRSPALDVAPAVGGTDLDGNPYDQDVAAVPNISGPRDLGVYEMQPIPDRIFGDALGDALSLVY